MKKKAKPTYKRPVISRRLDELVTKMRRLFGVQNYEMNFCFQKRDKDDVVLSIERDEKYQRIYLNFYPCFFKADFDRQREHMLHEFCHMITGPMLDAIDDLRGGRLVTPQQCTALSEAATSKISLMLNDIMTGAEKKTADIYKKYVDQKKK